MVKGSGLIVSALENEGVDLIFGIPGEETLDFVGSKIKFVAARHEQTAVYMAAAHGRLTGRAGVCLATLGPGALNFCNGAANGHLGAWPVLSQKAIRTDRQAGFQKVDTVSVMKGSGQEQFKILR
ncbi:hypothetical protein CN204_31845 [Sinorhizobium meliloti]|nr:hypothetical protein CN204_31845 [Sinorhizobium meliloti]RVM20839.1 hypothetical protein CN132_31960 [Sinorhizobium meliloti]RVN99555.1 hypothetical protein CN102_31660 [Sinorhizobium meliloti]